MESYKKLKKQLLRDKEIRREYEKLVPEFSLIKMLIQKRIKQGLSQRELAREIGTKQSAISRFESGTYNPTISFLRKISEALGVQLKISIS